MLTKISPFEGMIHNSCIAKKCPESLNNFRYYHSGVQMVKMANTYWEEDSFEQAYKLYLKYLTLFIEKV